MAQTYDDELYDLSRTRRGTSALESAVAGSKLGYGLSASPYGALAGALIGGAAGAIGAGGPTDAEIDRARRIQELRSRRAAGMLGLTETERAALESQLIDPLRRTQREQQDAFMRASAAQDVGAGSFFKSSQAADDAMLRELATQRRAVEAENIRQAAEQRAELDKLLTEQSADVSAERKALLKALLGGAEDIASLSAGVAEDKQIAEEGARMMDAAAGVKESDYSDYDAFDDINNKYGGMY